MMMLSGPGGALRRVVTWDDSPRIVVKDDTHWVYRLYSADGDLLYVGVTENPRSRWKSHSNKAWFDEVAELRFLRFDTRDEAMRAERRAIYREQPRYNIRGRA